MEDEDGGSAVRYAWVRIRGAAPDLSNLDIPDNPYDVTILRCNKKYACAQSVPKLTRFKPDEQGAPTYECACANTVDAGSCFKLIEDPSADAGYRGIRAAPLETLRPDHWLGKGCVPKPCVEMAPTAENFPPFHSFPPACGGPALDGGSIFRLK
jgi:hypothetical protein